MPWLTMKIGLASAGKTLLQFKPRKASVYTKILALGLTIAVAVVGGWSLLAPEAPGVLYIDGVPIGVVAEEKLIEDAIQKAQDELERESGGEITGYASQITYSNEYEKKEFKTLTAEELCQIMKDKLDWQAACWIIDIRDKPSLCLLSKEDVNKTLEEIKKYYVKDNGEVEFENVSFQEDVKIVEGTSSLGEIKTPELAVEAMVKGLDKIVQHAVKSGESLWTIARANDLTVSELREMNPQLKGDLLQPGQQLNLVKADPLLTVVSTYKTTVEEKVPFKTTYIDEPSMWRGQNKVKQYGKYGDREVTYRITASNNQEIKREILSETLLAEPVTQVVLRGSKVIMASRGDGGSGLVGWPLRGKINSLYGKRGREIHTGIDIDGDTGDDIYAAEDGVVLSSGWQGGYGNLIVIDHGNGLSTRYGHLSQRLVSIGQQVKRGDVIGKCGSTGRSTGSHLHFEVRINGVHKNPLNYLER